MTLDSPCIGERRANRDHRFNIKEHVKIKIMANISIGFARSADATDMIQAAIVFYDFKLPAGFGVLVTMRSQVLGFGSLPPMADRNCRIILLRCVSKLCLPKQFLPPSQCHC